MCIPHPVGSYENQQHQGSYNLCGEATSEVVSKLVCGNKIERDMEQDSQNHTVVPAGSQLGTIKSREEVLQDSRAVNPHSATGMYIHSYICTIQCGIISNSH